MIKNADFRDLLALMFKPHPWHGIEAGDKLPELLNAYIEIVPTDTAKYEIDKRSGHLKVDRPQKYSNHCPTLYGFIPQTLCATKVGEYSSSRLGRPGIRGDGDPLDVCVLSERAILHGDILLKVIPIGGLRILDGEEADDKIIAVLKDDAVFGKWRDMRDCPPTLIDRLQHYFLTYKELPGSGPGPHVEITDVYSKLEAHAVIAASMADYREHFGDPDARLGQLRDMLVTLVRSKV